MIDLHTHTTASDGRLTPAQLLDRARAVGVHILSITDHDTLAGCLAASSMSGHGVELVAGIEISAAREDSDVHVLGYFIDPASASLHAFLSEQRERRIQRVRQIVVRLAACGIALDADAILQPALDDRSKSVGRPWVARALVRAGSVASVREAFDRWLSRGRPAFVPRPSVSPESTIERIHEAGGVASIAHPGLIGRDEWLDDLARAGVDAVEAYHPDHDAVRTAHYLEIAGRLGLAVSGGSDFHADDRRDRTLGSVSLPRDRYEHLVRLVDRRRPTRTY